MPAAKALPIELSPDHERQLKALVRAHSTPQKLAERARIILLAAEGPGRGADPSATGAFGAIRRATGAAGGWGGRRRRHGGRARLSDAPRCGAPAEIHPPGDLPDRGAGLRRPRDGWRCRSATGAKANWPARRWPAALSTALALLGRVFFKKRGRPQAAPHPLLADSQARSRLRRQVHRHLRRLPGRIRRGRTGRAHRLDRRDDRHPGAGTRRLQPCRCSPDRSNAVSSSTSATARRALIAAFDVATGQVHGTVSDTRTEADFVSFLAELFASAPARPRGGT